MNPAKVMVGRIKVLVDCPQEIPCDPCASACRSGAISIEGGVSGRPQVREDLCNGCLSCLDACPVSCIYLLEEMGGDMLVTLAHDRLPRPSRGEVVSLRDGDGRHLGRGKVERVRRSRRDDRLTIVKVRVPPDIAPAVRAIGFGDEDAILHPQPEDRAVQEMEAADFPVCRCEEVGYRSLKELVSVLGMRHVPNLRRVSRVGLGLCQGRSCTDLIIRALREEAGCDPVEAGLPRSRVPVRPISLGELGGLNRRDNGRSQR